MICIVIGACKYNSSILTIYVSNDTDIIIMSFFTLRCKQKGDRKLCEDLSLRRSKELPHFTYFMLSLSLSWLQVLLFKKKLFPEPLPFNLNWEGTDSLRQGRDPIPEVRHPLQHTFYLKWALLGENSQKHEGHLLVRLPATLKPGYTVMGRIFKRA